MVKSCAFFFPLVLIIYFLVDTSCFIWISFLVVAIPYENLVLTLQAPEVIDLLGVKCLI